MTRTIRLEIASRLEEVALVGVAVRALAAEAGLADPGGAELAVVEAVTNAIEHAYRGQGAHRVEVEVEVGDAAVTFEVRDRGRAMPPELVSTTPALEDFEPRELTHLPEGGMGLLLIRRLMDAVRYERRSDVNILTLTRNL